ncbi:hypothetical protein BN946_scf184298.g7 [Trametes cinnabarina]|uniref:Uncharacterized protein n=1 Tax=Pycnoporus cinnabarinus TaxID=5643 RepID=A0A060SRH7_PYCCI|nr:hypothetical protein BN946_scf184298.g7 [Trametes cinnabarina]
MKIRNRGGVPDAHGTYRWPDRHTPSQVGWTSVNCVAVVPEPPKGLPDVPLNVEHRYCTPPPIDPRYRDPPSTVKDDFPQNFSREPSPGDFEELTGQRAPTAPPGLTKHRHAPAPPGSKHNPYVVEDDDNARRHRERRRQAVAAEQERARPVASASRQPTGGHSQTSPNPSLTSSSLLHSTRGSTGSRSSLQPPISPPTTPARYNKTAPDGFSPKTSSPLKQVVYKEPTPHSTPVSSRWYIPPRKHSTGSSDGSSDSD